MWWRGELQVKRSSNDGNWEDDYLLKITGASGVSCCRGTFTTGLDIELMSRVSCTPVDRIVIGHRPAPGTAFHQSQSLASKPVKC
jgi:hypothetical protein